MFRRGRGGWGGGANRVHERQVNSLHSAVATHVITSLVDVANFCQPETRLQVGNSCQKATECHRMPEYKMLDPCRTPATQVALAQSNIEVPSGGLLTELLLPHHGVQRHHVRRHGPPVGAHRGRHEPSRCRRTGLQGEGAEG